MRPYCLKLPVREEGPSAEADDRKVLRNRYDTDNTDESQRAGLGTGI
jgi:hypothetical protein